MWTFLGSVLLLIALPGFIGSLSEISEQKAQLLADPAVGDVWTIKLRHEHYTMYLVEAVSVDSIHLRKNTRDTIGGVMKLVYFQSKALNDFNGEQVGYARSEIGKLEKKGFIRSAMRNVPSR